MKKILKVLLVLTLIVPSMMVYSYNANINLVAAKTVGNYTYEALDDHSITITNYSGSEKDVVVPSEIDGKTVKKIGYSAFAECKSIETVVVPNTVATIGENAFSQCSQLKDIKLADSVVAIEKYSFSGCISLKTIVIPTRIRGLGYGAFFDCISLENVTLPEGLQTIGEGSFGNCRALTTIDFPSSLNSIEGNAFTGCSALQSIDLPEGMSFIGSGVFSGNLSLSNVKLPETLRGIGQSAFQDCVNLKSIMIPDGVSGIGYSAFSGCTNLTEINIPKGLTEIGNALFSGCSTLETIVIPANISTIGEFAFSGCTNLKNVELPNSVTEIGQETFSYCSSLKTITLPKNMNVISANLFRYCTSLETLIVANGVSEINATALADCPNLLSVTIPNTVKTLGSRVFSNSPQVTLRVDSGSEAYRYAVNNNIKYIVFESGVNLDKAEINLKVGKTSTFTVILYPYTIIDNSKFTWTSSNPSVASVQGDGVVSAIASGETIISVKNSNGQSASAKVIVDDVEVPIVSIALNNESLKLKKDSSTNLRAIINPSNTTMDKNIVWTSADEKIVSVSSIGSLRAKYPGTTTITAKTSNGLEASCEVVVISEIKSVSLNQTAMVMEENSEQSLRATINPIDTTDPKDIKWVSSNTDVAVVDAHGIVQAINKGTATVSAIAFNGKRAECKINVVKTEIEIPITSVTLNKNEVSLIEEDTETLVATINPDNTTADKTLTWTSSDEDVASVKDGKVTAIKAGVATISVQTSNGLDAKCEVSVSRKEVPITSVTLNKKELSLIEEDTETLVATINPDNTTADKTLTWTSSDEDVASVKDGKVTAIKAGVATISVQTSNGLDAKCEVSVSRKEVAITSVTLNKKELSLIEEDTETLVATINPDNTTADKTLTWTSSDSDVASVKDGKVTAIKAGVATISVQTSNGLNAKCEVSVSRKEVAITSVTLNKKSATLKVGKEETLVATINPDNTTADKTLTWTSSDSDVASVKDGKVTAIKTGVVTIRVTTSNNLFDEATITVYEVNKTLLTEAISAAEKIDVTLYTKSGVTKLNDTINKAIEINQNENATQEQVNSVIVDLENAIKMLVLKASDDAITQLEKMTNDAVLLSDKFSVADFAKTEELIKQVETLFEKDRDEISNAEVTSIVDKLAIELKSLNEIIDVRELLKRVVDSSLTIVNGDISDIDRTIIAKMNAEILIAEDYLTQLSSDKTKMEASIKVLNELIVESETKLDKSLLEGVIELYYTYDSSAYSSDSWKVLEKEVKNAEKLLASSSLTQDEIITQYTKIMEAFDNLQYKVDTTALEFNIGMAQDILNSSSQYVARTIKGLDAIVAQGNDLLSNKNITQEAIKDMNKKLIKAIMKARLKAI